MSRPIVNVSRRGFLGSLLGAGAFVLATRCGMNSPESAAYVSSAESAAFSPPFPLSFPLGLSAQTRDMFGPDAGALQGRRC